MRSRNSRKWSPRMSKYNWRETNAPSQHGNWTRRSMTNTARARVRPPAHRALPAQHCLSGIVFSALWWRLLFSRRACPFTFQPTPETRCCQRNSLPRNTCLLHQLLVGSCVCSPAMLLAPLACPKDCNRLASSIASQAWGSWTKNNCCLRWQNHSTYGIQNKTCSKWQHCCVPVATSVDAHWAFVFRPLKNTFSSCSWRCVFGVSSVGVL